MTCMVFTVQGFYATENSAPPLDKLASPWPKETPLKTRGPCQIRPIPVCKRCTSNLLFLTPKSQCVYSEIANWIAFQDICPAKNQSPCSRNSTGRAGFLYPQNQPLEFPNLLSTSCISQLEPRNNGSLLLLSSTWISFDPVRPSATLSNIKTVHMTREGILVRTHPFSRHNTAPDETETSIRMLEDYTRIFMRGAPR